MSEPKGKDEDVLITLDPVLEAPPAVDTPLAGLGASPMTGLFGDASLVQLTGKFTAAEAFLKLVTKDESFHDFVRELLMVVMKVIKSEAGSILEMDHTRNVFFFRAVVGTSSDRVTNFTVPFGQGIVGHVAEARRPLVVDNVAENRLHLNAIQKAVGFEARNLVAVPLIIRGRVFGVLELLNRIGEENYTPADLDLLTYICEMASKAIEIRLMISWSARQGSRGGSKPEAA